RESLLPTLSSITTNTRPNVTLVQPFKSSSLSSSPINHEMNMPSPIYFDRTSPLHRSPSQPSLQQRNVYQQPSSTRPLSINGGTAPLSSSVKSTSSAGSPGIPKFSSSFSHYRYERSSGSATRERDGSISSRRRSRSSLTNRSDGSSGSFNSSFFTSLDPEDDIGEFVQMVMTREPLNMFSRSPTGPDDTNDSGRNLSGSVYRTQQQLSRFQKLREAHNNLPDSMTSIGLQTSPHQLDPP
ncbi:12268_t:CDS:2, partial [Acaulospora morrowiae]